MNIKRIGIGVLVGLCILHIGLWLYEVHLPGFKPKDLPCSNTQPALTFDQDPTHRTAFCKVSNASWVEIWEKRGDRWVRLGREQVLVKPLNQVESLSDKVI